MTLGTRLRELRIRAGLSARELSLKAGLSQSTVNDIERKPDTSPRLSSVEALAQTLGVSLAYLAEGRTDNEGPPGMRESDAAPWRLPPPSGQRPDLADPQRRLPQLLAPRGRTLETYSLSHDMPGFGLYSGDVLVIDLKTPPEAGDLVLATVVDLSTGSGSTVLRRFLPPYLISGDPTLDRVPLVVDNARTSILGRIAASFRAPDLAA